MQGELYCIIDLFDNPQRHLYYKNVTLANNDFLM